MYKIYSSILLKNTFQLLKIDKAEIHQKGNKELKSIVIDNQTFRDNKNKDISKRLKKKLESVKKTIEYRSYNHKIISLAVGMKEALTKYATKISSGQKKVNQLLKDMPIISSS